MARILVVDDSMPIRKFMIECLMDMGFEDITEAVNGKQALEISKTMMPDIITLDWNMPEMDGLQYLQALRQLPGGDKPIVVFCSTESSHNKIQLVMKNGANAYITKPFDINTVRDKFELLGIL